MDRRTLFKALPFVGVGAIPAIITAKKLTAKERYEYHLAEMQRAAEEIDPTINRWEGGHFGRSIYDSMPLAIYARRYAQWELQALNGAPFEEVNQLRREAGLDPLGGKGW
jgi:hypothetical protein